MDRSPEELQRELEAISEKDGVRYARAGRVYEAQKAHELAALNYGGHFVISDAFKCFFLETVDLINKVGSQPSQDVVPEGFLIFIPRLTNAFHCLCAAEIVAAKGYPYQGFTLLRNVFDDLVLISAALQGLTDYRKIMGLEEDAPFRPDEARKLRKGNEQQVRAQMTGKRSGLSTETRIELSRLNSLYDAETHGGQLSFSSRAGAWFKGEASLPTVPTFQESAFAMFVNRFAEVAWMMHRLMPAVQMQGRLFPDDWQKKWRIVDQAFTEMVESLSTQAGKPVGKAVVEFVSKKFPFNEMTTFPLTS